MNVSELSFDPGALTPEAIEAARQIRSSWPDDLINYVFLKEQGRFFAFLQPDPRRRAKFYAVLADREFNLSWMMYYAFVRATIFERIPQILRQVTTVRQVLGPVAIEVYDLHQAVRRFMQVCRTICDYDEHRNDTRPPPFSPELRQPPRRHSVSEIAVEEDHH